jgi:hypothetical protein
MLQLKLAVVRYFAVHVTVPFLAIERNQPEKLKLANDSQVIHAAVFVGAMLDCRQYPALFCGENHAPAFPLLHREFSSFHFSTRPQDVQKYSAVEL